jgi:hypothetical protein
VIRAAAKHPFDHLTGDDITAAKTAAMIEANDALRPIAKKGKDYVTVASFKKPLNKLVDDWVKDNKDWRFAKVLHLMPDAVRARRARQAMTKKAMEEGAEMQKTQLDIPARRAAKPKPAKGVKRARSPEPEPEPEPEVDCDIEEANDNSSSSVVIEAPSPPLKHRQVAVLKSDAKGFNEQIRERRERMIADLMSKVDAEITKNIEMENERAIITLPSLATVKTDTKTEFFRQLRANFPSQLWYERIQNGIAEWLKVPQEAAQVPDAIFYELRMNQ